MPGQPLSIARAITDLVAPGGNAVPLERVVGENAILGLECCGTGFYYAPPADPGTTQLLGINYPNIPAGFTTDPLGINDSRTVVAAYGDANTAEHGFIYPNGAFQALDFPNAPWTIPVSINNPGTIVGEYELSLSGPLHGFIYQGGAFATNDYPGAKATRLHGISNSGQIVGRYFDGHTWHGMLLTGTTFSTIDPPGATFTALTGINLNGKIVEWFVDVDQVMQAFLATPLNSGTIGQGGGSANTGANGAALIVPPGVFSTDTGVALEVLPTPLPVTNPAGYPGPGTHFVIVNLSPEPGFPLPPPGVTLTLPTNGPMTPGERVDLFRVDFSGHLVPEPDINGNPAMGMVDAGGMTATFLHVAQLSTVVGLAPNNVGIDIKPGEDPATIQPSSHGLTPVAILSSMSFNAPAMVNAATLTFGHTGNEKSLAFCSGAADVNGDGLADLVCHFDTVKAVFQTGDTVGILEGKTVNNVSLQGSDTIRGVKCERISGEVCGLRAETSFSPADDPPWETDSVPLSE